ncbi:hypothetical protein CHRY9390_03215 [Chryseobacterium aquaeductus]|uniref:Redox-active disulfide protein 2 n=1 Tax=Chryseobacterium aquaeductus TaxID=2675056 RepID=A0A9N8MJU0_9FLAO|nr:hypothetical protein [Chryseobacterium aquaeductus]CAA7332492.1 hypothetical protein CHRY9390_03215 [Chryseobacterium potabilaquae]CAD7816666.1 hypothetical protein CHRY9390_03215 [Chryseobacterium aquaeductus]
MQKKILSDQSLEELKITKKKYNTQMMIHTVLLLILTVAAVYFTMTEGFTIFTFLPIVYVPVFIFALFKLKRTNDEIKVRQRHIFIQYKNK